MKPSNLKTKIFLDGGYPKETKEIISLLGFLDGQTTNPTLIAKHPKVQECLRRRDKCTSKEAFGYYREIVEVISGLIPKGSVSIEVYSDQKTSAKTMFRQGEEMFQWIPNAHLKYPITKEGLKAATQSIKRGRRVNMTLNFSQEQAAAVYTSTKGAVKGNVFISPFIGRLDDQGKNGVSLIKNIIQMYSAGDGHVEVLAASIRSLDHFFAALSAGADIITAPFKILKEWGNKGMPLPGRDYKYNPSNLKAIPYQKISLEKEWPDYNIAHELTASGLNKFARDWNMLVK